MSTASSRCGARIRGGIPRDLEGRGGDSCPTRLRGSELLLSTPCCIGSRRGGRIGCRGRVGACGRLRVDTVCVVLAGLSHLAPQVFGTNRSHIFNGFTDSFVGFAEEAEDKGGDGAEFVQA